VVCLLVLELAANSCEVTVGLILQNHKQSKDNDTIFYHVIIMLSMTDSKWVSSFLMAHHIKGNFSAIKWHGE